MNINWNNFANHYWPAKYLVDKTGKIVYTHFGEGAYGETEQKKAILKPTHLLFRAAAN